MSSSTQHFILHSLIAKGDYLVADYSFAIDEDYLALLCRKVLNRIPRTPGRRSYIFENETFNYLIDGEMIFMCVSSKDTSYELPWKFLGDIRYAYRHEAQRPLNKNESLKAELTRKLKEYMVYHNTHFTGKEERVVNQLESMKDVMRQNIAKVVDRGEQIESLVSKTTNLRGEMGNFYSGSRAIKRYEHRAQRKVLLLLGLVATVAFISILSLFCGGWSFSNCF